MALLGPKIIKFALVATVLAALVIGVVIAAIYVFTNDEITEQCANSTLYDLRFTQSQHYLIIDWNSSDTCYKNYKISLSYNNSEPIEVDTVQNQYIYQDLDYCGELTVTVYGEKDQITDTFLPEIEGVNNLDIIDGQVEWDKKHFESCNYKVKISDRDVCEVDDFFELPQDLDTCKSHVVTVTPFNSNKDGKSESKQFNLEIGQVSDVIITNDDVKWNNIKVKSCRFVVEVDGNISEDIPAESDSYSFQPSLEFCSQHEINITAMSADLENNGTTYSKMFENGPTYEDFKIESTNNPDIIRATWENSHSRCNHSIELNGHKIECVFQEATDAGCDIDLALLSEELELCYDYHFELKSKNIDGEDEYSSGNYSFSPTSVEKINISLGVNEEGLPVIEWNYIGPNCSYELIVNDNYNEPIIIKNEEDNDGVTYNTEIPIENLDLCNTDNEIILYAKYEEQKVAESEIKSYSPTPGLAIIENMTLILNEENQLVANWTDLGDSCSYKGTYKSSNGFTKDFDVIENNSVIIDEQVGKPLDYCTIHTVSVSAKNSVKNSEEESYEKNLTENFEAISQSITHSIVPNTYTIKISWKLNEEFKPCTDIIVYKVLYLNNNQEPQMDPETIDISEYVFKDYIIIPNTTFYVQIQGVQKNDEINGSKMVCNIYVNNEYVTTLMDCIYIKV